MMAALMEVHPLIRYTKIVRAIGKKNAQYLEEAGILRPQKLNGAYYVKTEDVQLALTVNEAARDYGDARVEKKLREMLKNVKIK
jgi:hypothetical protein